VATQMKHSDFQIRLLALSTKVQLAPKNHEGTIDCVCGMLEDTNIDVRLQAVSLLPRMSDRDDQHALEALAPRLRHKREEVRRAALKALALVASTENPEAISVANSLLHDVDYRVRQEAMKVVNQLAPEGHENLGICGPSIQRALMQCSSRVPRSNSAGSIFREVGQRLGQRDNAEDALDKLGWKECKEMSMKATAYTTKAKFALQAQQETALEEQARKEASSTLAREASRRAYQDYIMSVGGEENFRKFGGR